LNQKGGTAGVKKTQEKSIAYKNVRYFVPSSLLASQTTENEGKAKRKKMHLIPRLTYKMLREQQQRHAAAGLIKKQTAANRLTALNLFLRANQLHEDDVIASEFRTTYSQAIQTLVDALRAEDRTDRSISNVRSALTCFKEAVTEFDTQLALSEGDIPPFTKAVKSVMADHAVKRVGKQCGIPSDMLYGWLNGKWPRVSSIKYIRRLESFFALERDSLVSLAGFKGNERKEMGVGTAHPVEYREALSSRSQSPYWLVTTEDSPLGLQWTALLDYKTAAVPSLERTAKGRWTFAPLEATVRTEKNWWTFLNGREVPSARMAWARTASFLGWLSQPTANGGRNVPQEQLQTLAWFAVPGVLDDYLQWMKERAGGKHTGTTQEFIAMVRWMCRPENGYLYQCAHLQATLPNEYRRHDWHDMCARQFKYAGQLAQAYQSEIAPGRDPFQPLEQLIQVPEPMEFMADMVERMRRDRPIGKCKKTEAVWARDIFVIKLLLSNPIRLRNLACLKWYGIKGSRGSMDDGVLYQRDDGSWWIYIPKRLLKNRASTVSIRDYHAPVHQAVWRDMERYLFKHRPVLLREPTELVVLTKSLGPKSPTTGKADRSHRPYMDIGRTIFRLTRRYLWKSDGIGAHAFRHIVATSILKADGGDIKTAAMVLNDKETTVEKHYSGLRSADGNARMAVLLDKSFARM